MIVQPSAYGFDNRVTLAGLAALGNTARAVAVLPTDIADTDLERLHAAGVRGIRFNLIQPGPLSLADAPKL
ncbi:amidohydrolase family protein, partial [Salmonella enterica]|uniref:amidohydrolase family protein n=1 Tax=Salmonella enterica TaxID=28901 RepID=UPI003D7C204F